MPKVEITCCNLGLPILHLRYVEPPGCSLGLPALIRAAPSLAVLSSLASVQLRLSPSTFEEQRGEAVKAAVISAISGSMLAAPMRMSELLVGNAVGSVRVQHPLAGDSDRPVWHHLPYLREERRQRPAEAGRHRRGCDLPCSVHDSDSKQGVVWRDLAAARRAHR